MYFLLIKINVNYLLTFKRHLFGNHPARLCASKDSPEHLNKVLLVVQKLKYYVLCLKQKCLLHILSCGRHYHRNILKYTTKWPTAGILGAKEIKKVVVEVLMETRGVRNACPS